jgi:hypothetical protein
MTMKDVPNPYFELSEENRPAIRALRKRLLDVCEGNAGDLCIQALIEALVHAVNRRMEETDHAAAARTIAGLIIQALDAPEATKQ